ncbi:MAG: NUDIX hydrolase [Flavobacterium sp.]|nr:NUDIX hydrolase [Flavobacterium sp.]
MRTSNIYVTVDAVIFRESISDIEILLIRRKNAPFQGDWALPGGFVNHHEDLDKAAMRELEEETGLSGIVLSQFHTFGTPHRDPRGHTVSVAYIGLAARNANAIAADDASEAVWFSVKKLPALAFDHSDIISIALKLKYGISNTKMG